MVGDDICNAMETAVGGEESRVQPPQDRFGFLLNKQQSLY